MAYPTLYPAQANSPATKLASSVDVTDTTIVVADGSQMLDPPCYLTIGNNEDAETVLMTAKAGNFLTVVRAVEGIARPWDTGESVARNFTAADHNALIDWVKNLKDDVHQIANPNLLINPNFTINQRGQNEYTVFGYGPDMWLCAPNGGTVVISESSATLNAYPGNECWMFQYFENADRFRGKTLTVSALTSRGLVEITASIPISGTMPYALGEIRDENGAVLFRTGLSILDISKGLEFTLQSLTTLGITVFSTKLELGNISTLAYDAPPDPALELAKCQRYLQRLVYPAQQRVSFLSPDFMDFVYPTPQTMRIKPMLIDCGNFNVRAFDGADVGGFVCESVFATDESVIIRANKAAHGMQDAQLYVAARQVLLSAEL